MNVKHLGNTEITESENLEAKRSVWKQKPDGRVEAKHDEFSQLKLLWRTT